MTKEECVALLYRYAEYAGMGIPNLAGCREAMKMAADLLSQPSLPDNLELNMTRTKLELDEIETLTHLVRARAVELGPFQGLYKNILSKLNKMFDEEYAMQREKKGGKDMIPDKIYLRIQDLGSGYVYGISLNDNEEQEYIRKDALIEWAKELNEAYHKKYEESNHTCGEHWGQMVAFRRIIDKLNSM